MVLIKSALELLGNSDVSVKDIKYALYSNIYTEDTGTITNNFYNKSVTWLSCDYTFEPNQFLHIKFKDDRVSTYNQAYFVLSIVEEGEDSERQVPFFLIRSLSNIEIYKTDYEKSLGTDDSDFIKSELIEKEENWLVIDLREHLIRANIEYAPNHLKVRKGSVDHRHFHRTGEYNEPYIIRNVMPYVKNERAYRCLMSRGNLGQIRNPNLP